METVLASLREPRLWAGKKVGRFGNMNAPGLSGSFHIKHVCILRSVLPTLTFQKEHLDLSGVSVSSAKTWRGYQEDWGEKEARLLLLWG